VSLSITREWNKDARGQNLKELRIKLKESEFSGRIVEWNAFEN